MVGTHNKAHIIAILDMSGSMGNLKEEVIGSFNEFVKKQKEDTEPSVISLVLFDNNIERPFTRVPAEDFNKIDGSVYSPRGLTSLYDAIGTTINLFDEDENVIMLIQTDGDENSSREFTQAGVKALIEKKTKQGWDINFLAANIDVEKTARGMGIVASKSIAFEASTNGIKDAYSSMDHSTKLYKAQIKVKDEDGRNQE